MDITLERILSLLPRKENGKFVHGVLSEFYEATGAPHSAITQWVQGDTKSYTKYLYQISQKYGVSVEWLKGETNEKNPPSNNESGLDDIDAEIIELLKSKTPEQRAAILQLLRSNL